MQRWTVGLFAAVLALSVVIIVKLGARPGAPPAGSAPEADRRLPVILASATPPPTPALKLDLDAGIELPTDTTVDAGRGEVLPNGKSAPALPSGAPQAVSFGAVLVEYAGAEGAPRSARTKEEALALAKKLAFLAKSDFGAAVEAGDKGSDDDYGEVPRGVLEPGPEYVLFSLSKGEVSEPVDGPRGFYVFKRTN